MQRIAFIAGNWKMHTTVAEAQALAAAIAGTCQNMPDRQVMLAPPFTALAAVSSAISDSPIMLAAQNVCWEPYGAFTGEISPGMLQDVGCQAVIIGHSERRQLFHESDSMINKRLLAAVHSGLTGVFCIGETLAERESGQTFTVVEEQLRNGMSGLTPSLLTQVVVAYEPVWAIGTGKTASKEQAQEVHGFIRDLLSRLFQKELAAQIRIVYGGSVKPSNIDELMRQPDIDGALVGGAALDAASFSRIIHFQI